MFGIIVAFKKYFPTRGILGSPWSNPIFLQFQLLFEDPYLWKVTLNTLYINFLRFLFVFTAPIIVALLFNELRSSHFRKFTQVVTYLPNFLSWIIVIGIIKNIFAVDGFINEFIIKTGGTYINFLGDQGAFIVLLIVSEIWKSAGFSSIIYIAALAGIDPSQYEAAELDGANRFQKMLYISFPGLSVALTINLVFFLAGFLNGNFDQIYNMYSVPVYDVADIIDTYVYRIGIIEGRFAFSTALGLFKSIIGTILILIANKIVKKLGGRLIW
jgi:putative aldouronate transport system permease protein